MVEAIFSVIPSVPAVSPELQGWLVAAIVFAMAFAPIWRLGNSLLDGWTRIHAPKPGQDINKIGGRFVGGTNKPGRN